MSWWNKPLWTRQTVLFASLSPKNQAAIKTTFVLQVILLLFSGMILDGGLTSRIVALATLGWWIGVLIILVFHSNSQRKSDELFLKTGFVLLMVISYLTIPLWGMLRG